MSNEIRNMLAFYAKHMPKRFLYNGMVIHSCEHMPEGQCFAGQEGEWTCLDCAGTGHGFKYSPPKEEP